MKKYIIFQIWGNNPLYLIGMIENIKLANIIYPTWNIRIYYDNVPNSWLEIISKYKIDLIKEKFNCNIQFQIWRILPLYDKKVDIFICRDADSRLNFREKAAVDEWLVSKKPLHIMRDHPTGHKSLILAGMCGFNNKIIKKTFKLIDINLIHKIKSYNYDSDQDFLRQIIFPFFKNNHLAHDKYKHYNFGCEKDFPPRDCSKFRICNFVGEVHDYYNNPITWSTKNKLQNLDLKDIKTSKIYGLEVPDEIECIKIEQKEKNDHTHYNSYNFRLLDKEFFVRLNEIQDLLENKNIKQIEILKKDNKMLQNEIKSFKINLEKNNYKKVQEFKVILNKLSYNYYVIRLILSFFILVFIYETFNNWW